ncbi:MAG: citrate synthase [Chloroherpetonaceae bacterium]|nr:citrate synthase [Chloroherpetonaceae bacterium]MCS7212286.1 citrate synthase [Chloroherpetonaceae bacterium]MDW8020125.1 citrate synthase [Chloroherpetonaceae bacterium]
MPDVLTNGSSAGNSEVKMQEQTQKVVPPKAGLEDIVAATSQICFIDGKKGRLVYRGYDIHDLVNGGATFEEVIYLLWYGKLPNRRELSDFTKRLAQHRRLPREVVAHLYTIPTSAPPMEALRSAVSELALYDNDERMTTEAHFEKAFKLMSQVATIVAFDERIRNEKDLIQPDPSLSFSANFLYMLTGKLPDAETERLFDICMILHADHELNASTFTARVIAATLSDMYSAIAGAIGALKGPLHGGANEQVMRMLIEIGDPSRAEGYVKKLLSEKKKIMGFGHRVYKTEDPRATHLRKMSELLGYRTGNLKWYEISRRIEALMLQEKGLYPNVDFYSASVYHLMGISIDLFTPIFAMSRTAGWIAHILEQYANNRLIRPTAEYVGPLDEKFIPIDERE